TKPAEATGRIRTRKSNQSPQKTVRLSVRIVLIDVVFMEKEEGRRKREEGRRKRVKGKRKR
ncbi:MAG: hypothetical protein ACRC62_08025, partial [Microcoleus sp.]